MTAREQILHSLHEQREALKRRYPIRRLALFGSWARGDAREDSDVDVLVDVDPSIGMVLGSGLENLLLIGSVESLKAQERT